MGSEHNNSSERDTGDYETDIIDKDLYEDIEDEEMYELVQAARIEALKRDRERKEENKQKRPFPKWAFWLIAIALVMNVFTFMPQKISIPAIDFLMASSKLSKDPTIKTYKEAVVTIEAEDSKGTGFSISEDGLIVTNAHVIEGAEDITIGFPTEGLYTAEVIERIPSIDTAILQVDGEELPFLEVAQETNLQKDAHVYFIGNPLSFHGIANEGKLIDYTILSSWDEHVGMIQAPIYRGNSGSPIINEGGKVIGVVFATTSHDLHGKVGLFVPVDVIDTYYPIIND